MKLLLSLLILAFSTSAFAAEKIVHEGEEGVFIKKAEAAEMTAQLKEYQSQKKQIELLNKNVELCEGLNDLKDDKFETQESIATAWHEAFKSAQQQVSEDDSRDDVRFYIYVGLFVGGTIVGAAIMYGSSSLLNNIK